MCRGKAPSCGVHSLLIQTRCPNGHDRRLPGATRLRADGRRECVECARDRVRRYRAKITTRIE